MTKGRLGRWGVVSLGQFRGWRGSGEVNSGGWGRFSVLGGVFVGFLSGFVQICLDGCGFVRVW